MAASFRRTASEMRDIMNQAIHHFSARGSRAAATALVLLILGSAGVGCEKNQASNIELAPVAGMVTLNEKPLSDAIIEFIPAGDTPGQGGAATTDVDGHFKVTSPFGEEGLP